MPTERMATGMRTPECLVNIEGLSVVVEHVHTQTKEKMPRLLTGALLGALLLVAAGRVAGEEAEAKLPQILQAAKDGDVKVLKEAVQKLKQDIEMRDEETGWTPLIHAAAAGRLDALVYLISKRAKVDVRDFEDRNALMIAAARGQVDTLRFLMKKFPEGIDATDSVGWTPLHWAASWGKTQTAIALIDGGADLNVIDQEGRNPLEEARHVGMQQTADLIETRMSIAEIKAAEREL